MEDAPDIVLMDVNLEGGREGIEAARWLREVCDIPVVFVTAYTDPDTVERIHEQVPGAPVIAKPLYGFAVLGLTLLGAFSFGVGFGQRLPFVCRSADLVLRLRIGRNIQNRSPTRRVKTTCTWEEILTCIGTT